MMMLGGRGYVSEDYTCSRVKWHVRIKILYRRLTFFFFYRISHVPYTLPIDPLHDILASNTEGTGIWFDIS